MDVPTVTPKSLVLDLLSTHREGPLASTALVRAGAVFGFEPSTVRMALSRLARAGHVASVARGVWALTPKAEPLARHVSAWRSLEERVRPWAGGWIAVATGGLTRADRAGLGRRTRALKFWGFRRLRPGLQLRPDNLVQGADTVRADLVELGLEASAPVFAIADLGPQCSEAEALWSGPRLTAAYRAHRQALLMCAERWQHQLDDPAAARETFEKGGAVLRLLAYDPLLPEPIVDVAARRALVDEMAHFDRLGRAAWERVLALEAAS